MVDVDRSTGGAGVHRPADASDSDRAARGLGVDGAGRMVDSDGAPGGSTVDGTRDFADRKVAAGGAGDDFALDVRDADLAPGRRQVEIEAPRHGDLEDRRIIGAERSEETPFLPARADGDRSILLVEFKRLQLGRAFDNDIHRIAVPGLDLDLAPVRVEHEAASRRDIERPLLGFRHRAGCQQRGERPEKERASAGMHCVLHDESSNSVSMPTVIKTRANCQLHYEQQVTKAKPHCGRVIDQLA